MGQHRVPLAIRFWAKVDYWDPDHCWLWIGARTGSGYGALHEGAPSEHQLSAHRVSYELLVGPIPAGLTIDHLCRVKACVNPKHLEPVTQRENTMRNGSVVALNAQKTRCHRGHPFDSLNTWIDKRGKRYCRTCQRIWQVAYRERRTP